MASSLAPKPKLNANARLRFAPSPTGNLHIGGLRTALYNHLLARKWGGKWILRIEDTDQVRKVDGAVDSLRRSLEWAGLDYDEGPGAGSRGKWSYIQSERLDLYRYHVQQLLDTNQAYRCFCTSTELAQIKEDLRKRGSPNTYDRTALRLTDEEVARKIKAGEKHVVRFKSSPGPIPFTDLVQGGTEAIPSAPMDDMVLLKSDGYPTYHLANVVDDHEMGITHVLRGEEWRTSVNKHLQLYNAFGWERPEFAHLPLLVNPDGSKLSKRHGAVSVEEFRAQGYEPSALLNFVGLMGWAGPQAASSSPTSPSSRDHDAASPFLPSSTDSEPHKSLDYAQVEDCLTVEEMIEKIEIPQIMNRQQQVFLPNLLWLQKLHVNRRWESSSASRLAMVHEIKEVLMERYPDSPRARDDTFIDRLLDSERVRLTFPKDVSLNAFLFSDEVDLDTDEARAVKKKVVSTYLSTLSPLLHHLSSLPDSTWASSSLLKSAIDALVPDPKQRGGKLWTPLRHALTGMKTGPSVAVTMSLLGREESCRRVEAGVKHHEREHGAEGKM